MEIPKKLFSKTAVIIVFLLPFICPFIYSIYIEQLRTKDEQLKTKDIQIDVLNQKIKNLEDFQISEVLEDYKNTKIYYKNKLIELNAKYKNATFLNDSLKTYIAGPFITHKNFLTLTNEQSKKVIIALEKGKYYEEKTTLLMKIINNYESILKGKNQLLYNKDQIIKIYQKNKP